MTHFVGLVVANSEDEIAKIVAKFDENTQVAPYPVEVDEDDLARMAEHYKVEKVLYELLPHMQDWRSARGEIIDGKLYYFSTRNPDSRWDWYKVGGRWKGEVPNNRCRASEVARHFTEYLPSVIVDAEGWHAAKSWGWFGTSETTETDSIVREKLDALAAGGDPLVFVVDFHI